MDHMWSNNNNNNNNEVEVCPKTLHIKELVSCHSQTLLHSNIEIHQLNKYIWIPKLFIIGFYSIWPFGSYMFNILSVFSEWGWSGSGKNNSPGLRQICVQIPSLLLMSWVSLDKDITSLTLIFLICKMRIALVFTL